MKSSEQIKIFQKIVHDYYKHHGRYDLPWRKTKDPYKIWISEAMLQQTQVERVRPFYTEFVKKFQTVNALAAAPLADVLKAWQGLGYNSRAKRLQDAAKEIVNRYKGKMPSDAAQLEALPGIGPYTARAVSTFAHNHDAIFIETNIRTVVQHHFFAKKEQVSDEEIAEVLKRALPHGNAREWYSALMDYGSYLKRSGVKLNSKTKGYKKQTTFEGSKRQARGAILKALVMGPRTSTFLIDLLGIERRQQMLAQLASMTKEGLIELKSKKFQLPS
jgi:A/G-specific adenine glycosylase